MYYVAEFSSGLRLSGSDPQDNTVSGSNLQENPGSGSNRISSIIFSIDIYRTKKLFENPNSDISCSGN